MTAQELARLIRNTPVGELVRALERDGFAYKRRKKSGRLYCHPDGRRAVIHYHRAATPSPSAHSAP
jgi:predicted RNA binding protein YcfA (HicA-like mRNA interferase family)